MRRTLTLGIAALALGPLEPAAADMFKPSMQDQVKLGQRAAADVRKQEKVLPERDPRVLTLRRVGERLLVKLPSRDTANKPWKFSFDMVASKEMNAFALPGGPVFFYTALVDKFKTEDQLAGVLAHEIMHVTKEHWANAYADSQKRQLGLSALLFLLNANQTAFDIAGVSNALLFELPYSRRHESEADTLGMKLMVEAGYNPQGMVDVFKILASAGGGKPPEFLSTHPDDKNRIKRLQEMADNMGKEFAPQKPLSFGPTGRWGGNVAKAGR